MSHPATERLLQELSSPITVVDVGARGGVVPSWRELGGKGRLICFDPDEAECERLNAEDDRATYMPLALADHDRGVTIHITEGVACSSIYAPKPVLYQRYPGLGIIRPMRKLDCPSITLDHYCAQNDIKAVDAVKLDTQGSELDVLRGATQTLSAVSMIDIEVEFNELYEGQPLFGDVDGFLRSHGFVLWRMSTFAHYSPGIVDGGKTGIVMSSDPGAFTVVEQDNGQLYWAQAHYVRREFTPANPRTRIDSEQALKAAILVGQYGFWDLSREILSKCDDSRLFDILDLLIRPVAR